MPHDIIDNRERLLVDDINRILETTYAARFAVGYFFLSGLTSIARTLGEMKDLRLLIGNTTSRETIEQIAEGYRQIDLLRERAEAEAYPKKTEAKKMAAETQDNLRSTAGLMDQTDDAQALVVSLVKLIEERRLKVRVFTKGRLHAKAYIFDYGQVFDSKGRPVERRENGIAIVGSSNLSLAGITHNTELNVVVSGNDNHAELVKWFDTLWKESQDFDESLVEELRASWALCPARPYDVYMKTLYALVRDRLESEDDKDFLWDEDINKRLADFQKVAVRQAVQTIRDYGGVFVADVVGLGKSYVGAAIVKHFERAEHARPLILCPATLVEMWESYNEVYQLNARVVSMGLLLDDERGTANFLAENPKYRDRDFLLIDESHNLRNADTQRYKVVQAFLAPGKRCCMLTATPRNRGVWDIYHQLKLFHQDDRTDLPVSPPHLKDFFKLVEVGQRRLQDLLQNVLIRRTRNHILKWYGVDGETHQPIDPARFRDYADGRRRGYVLVGGKPNFFPHRELHTIEYSIEDTYQGLYQQIRGYLGKSRRKPLAKLRAGELTYARYGLWHFVTPGKQKREPYLSLHRAGGNLRGLVRVLLFKRFESSVYAFRETVRRLILVHEAFVAALDEGIVPAGEEAQALLYESDQMEEADLFDALRSTSRRYDAGDFDLDRLAEHVRHDVLLLKKILDVVKPITPEQDAKLQTLKQRLGQPPLRDGKRLIFTQYADTARYLFENLNPGRKRPDIEVIFSGDKSKAKVVGRFAPKANPEYRFLPGEKELQMVIATDVLAEGLNLQDCDKVVNYDLHWNPVRLIQRFGRIDRIGTVHEEIHGFNFLPETGLDRNLGLRRILQNRIQEIHDTIGEDSAILDRTEQLNEEAMYVIYEQKGQLSLFEDEEDTVDLNEAEEILRQLRRDNPEEYDRIVNLRDGIRSARTSGSRGLYALCEAGSYRQLFLVDEKGEEVSRDPSRILGLLKCGPDLPAQPLAKDHNAAVMAVKTKFAVEAAQRQAEREHTLSLSHGQRYVLRELRVAFAGTGDEDLRGQITILEKAFRTAVTGAVQRELVAMRRGSVVGEHLVKELTRVYHQHNLREWLDRRGEREGPVVTKIVCSERLL